jgi:hypothetical protein
LQVPIKEIPVLNQMDIKCFILRMMVVIAGTRVINGKDSLFCYGKYIQTSDTSLLWEEKQVINFKVTHLDTIFPGAVQLQIFGSPIVPLMYNIY